MEKIIIKNFLIFDDVEMPIKRLNVLIGEQASGKSLLAKLVYFFKQIKIIFRMHLSVGAKLSEIIREIEKEFEEIFSLKDYKYKNSEILYFYNDIDFIRIKHSEISQENFKVELPVSFIKLAEESLAKYKEIDKSLADIEGSTKESLKTINMVYLYNEISEKLNIKADNAFVPANRILFALLERNSFSLLTNNQLSIDKLTKDFGILCQSIKRNFKNDFEKHENLLLTNYFEKIIKGKYKNIDGEDWIIGNNYKVSVSKASSGQQEIFPLMLVLSALIINEEYYLKFHNLFIEEPEAHLFPQAQGYVVSAILYIMSQTETSFFITTHSPYILTALNNSIYAQKLINDGKLTQEQFVNLSNGSYPIDFNDISAFSLEHGKIQDIKDSEYHLIGGEIIDQVSNEFGKVFDTLMELDS